MEFLFFFFLMSLATLTAIVILIWRYLRYRETVALAERGLVRPRADDENGRGTLRSGLLFTFIGIALMIGLYPIGWATENTFLFRLGPWMVGGLVIAAIGLAQLLIYVVTRREERERYGSTLGLPPAAEMERSETSD